MDHTATTAQSSPARAARVDVALSNSIGLGGHNSALIFRRYVS